MEHESSRLRVLREGRGWSRDAMVEKFGAVAAELGFSALSISARQIQRWEGQTPPKPRPKQAEVLEALFESSQADLGLSQPDMPSRDPDVWTIDSTRAVIREAIAMSRRVDRRTMLKRSGATLGAYLLRWVVNAPQFEHWEAVTRGQPLSDEIIDSLQTQVDGLRMWDAEVGGASLQDLARDTLQLAMGLVDQRNYDARVGRRLFAVTADAATLAGWFAFDAGQLVSADRYLDAAVQAAHAAEDQEIAAYAMSHMAIRNYATNHGRDGVTLMEAARSGLDSGSVPHLNAMLYLAEARSHAAAGSEADAYRSVDCALREFERGPSGDEPPWLYWITPGEVLGQAGSTALALRDYKRADALFREAADGYGDHANRSRTLHLIRRSIALAEAHSTDQAASVATEALASAVPVKSRRFCEHLADLKAILPRDSHDDTLRKAHYEIKEAMRASTCHEATPSSPS